MPAENMIVVGRLGSPYGVRGWLHLQSYTAPADNLMKYQPWFMQTSNSETVDSGSLKGQRWQPLTETKCRPHKKGFVVQINGITDRDSAAANSGRLIGVDRAVLPSVEAAGEIYWRDLVGCTVTTNTGVELGQVEYLLETGAHDVLVIGPLPGSKIAKSKQDQVLIPFVAEYVLDVNANDQTVTVNWDPSW
jgi:16S rRNA processing protein RimM